MTTTAVSNKGSCNGVDFRAIRVAKEKNIQMSIQLGRLYKIALEQEHFFKTPWRRLRRGRVAALLFVIHSWCAIGFLGASLASSLWPSCCL